MGYIQPFDRNQLTLPESLDSYISCENPVRLIDVFVDQFIKLHPDFPLIKVTVLRAVLLIALELYSSCMSTAI